ncbi:MULTISPECIES: c-type cytochrome [unclassified Psychrobacter]|uniref:c-type cytochrome n=1 Tax=unclassified Psychrobacter TaxID=196806 RepID=UPI00071E79B8|nr:MULTISPECIES: c-type cytochrome [unclassified Psychrobacter]OLF37621.1 cytochrome C [Psychrobacter sp. Cmf 22.2]
MIKKLTLYAFGISTLLLLSACSDNNTAEPPADAPAETSTAVEEAPATAPEASEPLTSELQTSEPAAVEAPATTTAEPAEAVEPSTADEPEVLAADAGAKLYESNCKVCHEAGLLDAPKYGDKAAWAPRLAKGIDTLHMHSAQGFNKMPAQATDKVSEAEVYAAVDYMVAAVS